MMLSEAYSGRSSVSEDMDQPVRPIPSHLYIIRFDYTFHCKPVTLKIETVSMATSYP